jgi:hypothetical protein
LVIVRTKAAGRRRPLVPDFAVPPPADDDVDPGSPVRLRDLISRVVVHEVEAFQARQEENVFLRALTEEEIERAAAGGAIRSGGSEVGVQEVDVDAAVDRALEAFEDGLFLVIVDRAQCRSLDERVQVGEESTVTFLRLVALAGG